MATEQKLREKVVATARSYLGVQQGSAKHKKIIDTFNTITPKPDGWAMTYTAFWCAAFASAIAVETFGLDKANKYFPLSANCDTIITKAKKMGIWVENDAYKPQQGDWILYDWEDNGKGDNKGTPNHVGIIESVDKSIIVIEGNKNRAVGERTLAINGRYIRGFVTPKYAAMATPAKKKSVETIAKEVIDGKWGAGDERKKKLKDAGYDYDAVQKKVNELLKKKEVSAVTKKGKAMADLARKQIGNGYKKYCKAFGKNTSWCQIFIWWLMMKKGITYLKDSYARHAAKWCKKHWKHISMKDARAGDIVFFSSEGKNHNNKMTGKVTHVGLIRAKGPVEKNGSVIKCRTIEGNVKKTKNQKGDWRVHVVARRTRSQSYVWGIFRPPYEK